MVCSETGCSILGGFSKNMRPSVMIEDGKGSISLSRRKGHAAKRKKGVQSVYVGSHGTCGELRGVDPCRSYPCM